MSPTLFSFLATKWMHPRTAHTKLLANQKTQYEVWNEDSSQGNRNLGQNEAQNFNYLHYNTTIFVQVSNGENGAFLVQKFLI
jgi:hypothetical protein